MNLRPELRPEPPGAAAVKPIQSQACVIRNTPRKDQGLSAARGRTCLRIKQRQRRPPTAAKNKAHVSMPSVSTDQLDILPPDARWCYWLRREAWGRDRPQPRWSKQHMTRSTSQGRSSAASPGCSRRPGRRATRQQVSHRGVRIALHKRHAHRPRPTSAGRMGRLKDKDATLRVFDLRPCPYPHYIPIV